MTTIEILINEPLEIMDIEEFSPAQFVADHLGDRRRPPAP